jgi:Sulfotransferase family
MAVHFLNIQARNRPSSTRVASVQDFLLSPGETVTCMHLADARGVAAQHARQLTPYCIDHERRCWLFAETPAAVDLSLAPFYYQRQFEQASRLLAVPYLDAEESVGSDLPEERVFIYGVGRCGSTLVSKLWQQLDDCLSLSEPDVFANLRDLRATHRITEDEARVLARTATHLLEENSGSLAASTPRRLVVKFRGSSIDDAELMHALFPTAKFLFLYRNAIDCVGSYVRIFGHEAIEVRALSEIDPTATPSDLNHLGRVAAPLVSWVAAIRRYLVYRERGLPFIALRYEDLLREPQAVIARMFSHCGAPHPKAERVTSVLSKDAQAGTKLAGALRAASAAPLVPDATTASVLNAAERSALVGFLRERVGMTAEELLPGTL